MGYKSQQQLQKENFKLLSILIVVSVVSLASVVLIGMSNLSAVDTARYYQDAYEKQKAKAKVLEDELYDIKTSGTCLSRIARFDKEMDIGA